MSSTTPDLTEIGQSDNANSTPTEPAITDDSVPSPNQTADLEEPANDNPSAEEAKSSLAPEPVSDNDVAADQPDITQVANDNPPPPTEEPI